MLKFLRRFGKHLIVVGGSLLLIAWLVPSAMQEWVQNPERRVVMYIDGKKVRAKEYQHWQLELAALRNLIGNDNDLFESVEHYMLLARSAQRSGLVGSATEGRSVIPVIATQRARMVEVRKIYEQNPNYAQFPVSLVSQLVQPADVAAQAVIQEAALNANLQEAANSSLPVKDIEMALARLRGISRLQSQYASIGRVSRPRALLEAQRQLDRSTIDVVMVSADRNIGEVGEPDDAALQEQLTKFKDLKPGEGEFGIGYLLPPRAKIQYLTLDRAKISQKISPDIKELKRVFRDEYTKTKPDETFEEARPALELQYKAKVVDQILVYADQSFRTEVALATRSLPDDPETGLKKLPADWADKRPDLSGLAHKIVAWVEDKTKPDPSRPGIRIDPPEVKTLESQFLTATELAELPGIGASSRVRGSSRESFAAYVLSVRELQPRSTLSLQVGIPFDEATKDNNGNQYHFVVLDTRPESVPASVDEARTMLVRDWKRLQAYKLLVDRDAEALKQRAIAEGLAALDERKPTFPGGPPTPSSLKSNLTVSRMNVSDASSGLDFPVFRDKVIEAASKFEPTQDVSALDVSARTFVVPMPQKLSLAVGVIKSLTPITVEAFRQNQLRLASQLQADEAKDMENSPYTLERLKKTFNVTYPIEEKLDDAEST